MRAEDQGYRMPAQVKAITQEVVLAVTITIPLERIYQNMDVAASTNTYIQSNRASFSRRVPVGVCRFKNVNISTAAMAETGRFRSTPR